MGAFSGTVVLVLGEVMMEKEKANSYWVWAPAPRSAEWAKGTQPPKPRLQASPNLLEPTIPQ